MVSHMPATANTTATDTRNDRVEAIRKAQSVPASWLKVGDILAGLQGYRKLESIASHGHIVSVTYTCGRSANMASDHIVRRVRRTADLTA